MTPEILARPRSPRLDSLLERLGRGHFRDSLLSIDDSGLVSAQFYRSRITSAFQPIVRAEGGEAVGHQALLRVASHTGESVAPWRLFAQASTDPSLVALDRLCRTVHALNYFPSHSGDGLLFLNVERRLLTGVAADHGAWFEPVLALIGVAPARVVIVMPPDAVEDPVAFVRAAISYRLRGYRVLATVHSSSEADLSHVFLADPHYVAMESAALRDAACRKLLDALAKRGTRLVARGVENSDHARAARAAGIELLQGFHFGRP